MTAAMDKPEPVEDWLDEALRAEGREHVATYLADDGFTARVLERLPRAAALPAWRGPVVALLWLVAASAGVAAAPDLFYDVFRGLVATVVAQPLTLSRIAVVLLMLGAIAWSTIVYAMRED
jgi:hypothetical protein